MVDDLAHFASTCRRDCPSDRIALIGGTAKTCDGGRTRPRHVRPTRSRTRIHIGTECLSRDVWKRPLILAVCIFLLSGSVSAHLVPGDPMHVDVDVSPKYVAGESVTFRLFVSNPGPDPVQLVWPNSCVLSGGVYSERRTLAFWPGSICLFVIVSLDVPADTSLHWMTFALPTREDDGCIDFNVGLNRHLEVRSGSARTCPASPPPPLGTISLSVSGPTAAKSGEVLGFSVQAWTSGGLAIEGIRIDAILGAEELPAAYTGLHGRLSITAPLPNVELTTLTTLLVHASGEGWRNASTSRTILIFPPDRRYLVLESRFATGDIMRTGEQAILEVTVRGNDRAPVPEAILAVDITDPLVVEENVALGDGRHRLTLRAGVVSEGRIVSVRIVASAPQSEGGETVVDYAVLPPTATTGHDLPESIDRPPWDAFAALGVLSAVAVVSFAMIRRHRKARRR